MIEFFSTRVLPLKRILKGACEDWNKAVEDAPNRGVMERAAELLKEHCE